MRYMRVNGFPDYLIYEDGRLFSEKRKKFLLPRKRGLKRRMYFCFALYNSMGVSKQIAVHRLVAEHFIENQENKPVVNHKDNDTSNNHVSNLEWTSYSENTQHSYDETDRQRAFKKVIQLDRKTGDVISIYNSLQDAANSTEIHYTGISRCAHGQQKSAGGYKWEVI